MEEAAECYPDGIQINLFSFTLSSFSGQSRWLSNASTDWIYYLGRHDFSHRLFRGDRADDTIRSDVENGERSTPRKTRTAFFELDGL